MRLHRGQNIRTLLMSRARSPHLRKSRGGANSCLCGPFQPTSPALLQFLRLSKCLPTACNLAPTPARLHPLQCPSIITSQAPASPKATWKMASETHCSDRPPPRDVRHPRRLLLLPLPLLLARVKAQRLTARREYAEVWEETAQTMAERLRYGVTAVAAAVDGTQPLSGTDGNSNLRSGSRSSSSTGSTGSTGSSSRRCRGWACVTAST